MASDDASEGDSGGRSYIDHGSDDTRTDCQIFEDAEHEWGKAIRLRGFAIGMGRKVKLIEAQQEKLRKQAMRLSKKMQAKESELRAARLIEEEALLGYARGDEELAALLERHFG